MRDFDPIPPKKSLGQHYLTNRGVAERMVEAAEVSSRDTVVEIGPGKGILTRELLPVAREVIAIEKDDRLALRINFDFKRELAEGTLVLVPGDALLWRPEDFLLQAGGYKLVANIPYYITGAIVRKFLSEAAYPSTIVILVQKEVARRIVARDGKESILSIAVKAYGEPAYVETVKAGQFNPPPKVDSAVLKIDGVSKRRFEEAGVPEESFFAVLRAGFAHKRKYLLSNLSLVAPKAAVDDAFTLAGLDGKVRPEDVPLDAWFSLASAIKNFGGRDA